MVARTVKMKSRALTWFVTTESYGDFVDKSEILSLPFSHASAEHWENVLWLSKVSWLIKARLGPVATIIQMTCSEYGDFVSKDVFIPSTQDLSNCWREMNEWNMYLSPLRTSTQKVACSQHEIYYYVTERSGCYWCYYCLHKTQRQTYTPQLTGNTTCTLIQTPHEHY